MRSPDVDVTHMLIFCSLEYKQEQIQLAGPMHYNPVSKKSTSGVTINIWAPQMGLIKTGPGLINPQMLILARMVILRPLEMFLLPDFHVPRHVY